MGFFLRSKSEVRYAALIDISSGSVLTAIIESDSKKKHPNIIWSKREQAPLRKIEAMADSAKGIITSLLNACLLLDSEGRKALYSHANTQKLSDLQITIGAPWAYTTTKTISYQNPEPFLITEDLIEELLRTANQKANEEMLEAEKLHNHNLEMVLKTTLQILANGYPIQINNKQKAISAEVIEASTIVEERLLLAVTETKEKIFPALGRDIYSFMLPFYFVMLDTINPATEFCLVDVTGEATELGVVRNGILTHVSHIPYGSYSIAREISEILKVPLSEAYGYLACDDFTCFTTLASDKQREEIDAVLLAYQSRLAALFNETGDALAIPKRIYLHGNLQTELFFEHYVAKAASGATKMQHATYNVTHQLLEKRFSKDEAKAFINSKNDSGLLISAQFFHTNQTADRFTQI